MKLLATLFKGNPFVGTSCSLLHDGQIVKKIKKLKLCSSYFTSPKIKNISGKIKLFIPSPGFKILNTKEEIYSKIATKF
ncbi:hypothetical protein BpHYR1_005604 [Brachionus plicatilis]|uniref:Uncharacterized protein n=1 Tax=Brachionus plicatilis TaxID=10195 RepID=A0A3M7PY77_BRAPC|nr:hypothetical protein BpHYR1_005604 [Brachionus plicatilis]